MDRADHSTRRHRDMHVVAGATGFAAFVSLSKEICVAAGMLPIYWPTD
jgi:hypothetical protein